MRFPEPRSRVGQCPRRRFGIGPTGGECGRRALLVAAPAGCAGSRGDGHWSMTPYAGWCPLRRVLWVKGRSAGVNERLQTCPAFVPVGGGMTGSSWQREPGGHTKTPQADTHLRRVACTGGEGGIRTRGGVTLTRFPIVRIRPDYATSPRFRRPDHYTIVATGCQIGV